jgi:hypothetical protein
MREPCGLAVFFFFGGVVLQVDTLTAERYDLCSAAGALTGGHSGRDV